MKELSLWTCQQIREAFPWDTAPVDGSYGPTFHSRPQAMGVEDVLIAPRSPWQNAYAERVIGCEAARAALAGVNVLIMSLS